MFFLMPSLASLIKGQQTGLVSSHRVGRPGRGHWGHTGFESNGHKEYDGVEGLPGFPRDFDLIRVRITWD
jgi:hypothetical protein